MSRFLKAVPALLALTLLTGCGEPSINEVAEAGGWQTQYMHNLSCAQASGQPGYVCLFEHDAQRGQMKIHIVKQDNGKWRKVSQEIIR